MHAHKRWAWATAEGEELDVLLDELQKHMSTHGHRITASQCIWSMGSLSLHKQGHARAHKAAVHKQQA